MDDCLIVGAGVVGLSVAYELACAGLRVRLVDQGEPGCGASWAGAGILPPANPETAHHPAEVLRGWSHRLHAEWARRLTAETGIDTGYRACGGIYVARTVGEAAALAGLAAELDASGIAWERLSPAALRACEPAVAAEVRTAYRLPGEAQLRNPHHLRALVTACRQRGVSIETGLAVRGFRGRPGVWEAAETDAGERRAGTFCITTGAWTRTLLGASGLNVDILPIRGQMVLFRTPQPWFRHVLNEGPRYLVPRDDGHVLVGSTEEEAGFVVETTPSAVAELIALARSLVPALEQAPVVRAWAGLRPGSLDGLPYVGPVPGVGNGFVAAGHFRSGLHLSPATAVVIGRLVRGLDPGLDLSPFRVDRGKRSGGEYGG